MSTPKSENPLDNALSAIEKSFRSRILKTYSEVKKNLSEYRFDSSGVSGGKFAETVLRFLQKQLTGTYIPFTQPITNFADECRKLVSLPKTVGNESQRVVFPRALLFMYTLRNKRGIGHVGGDVDANKTDATTIARVADWIICELIRIHHNLSLEDAEALVDSVSTKNLEDVWEVAGKKRVLRTDLSTKDKCLLLVYSCTDAGVAAEDLCEWVKYRGLPMFKRRVLEPLDKACLIEHDRDTDFVFISPIGIKEVEEKIHKRNPSNK
jgi:hypothetical protein